jgi:trehalose 6-phosphate synthase/phosphatase
MIVAFGDDVTDEDLFGGLPPGAISVAIGPNPVRGNLRLPGWEDARALLRAIAGGEAD